MKRSIWVLLSMLGVAGCATSVSDTGVWPAGEPFVKIERWELAGGVGYSCTIAHTKISIRTLNDFGAPPKVLFERSLSSSEFRSVISAVHDSHLLAHLGEVRSAPPRDDVIVLSDGRLDRFSFREGKPEEVKAAAVEYLNYVDASARRVFDAVDDLLPLKYRFVSVHEKQSEFRFEVLQSPNKSVQPTPGSVTPRASEGSSK